MTQPCEICTKELADKRSLRRHKQRVHGVQPEFPALECSTCGFETHKILIMKQHNRREHGGELQNQCAYCALVFNNQSNFHQHLNNAHRLPVWNRGQSNNQAVPAQPAILGVLEIYETEGNDHTDVLSFMSSSRYHINELIRQKTLEGPQKVQLCLSITLTKGVNEEEKHVTIYANAEMQIVYADGLSEELFFESVQHIVNVVSRYATSGSGWIIEKVEKLEIQFAKFNPIRGSTYIALPIELSALKCLIIIRNFNDPNCSCIVSRLPTICRGKVAPSRNLGIGTAKKQTPQHTLAQTF